MVCVVALDLLASVAGGLAGRAAAPAACSVVVHAVLLGLLLHRDTRRG